MNVVFGSIPFGVPWGVVGTPYGFFPMSGVNPNRMQTTSEHFQVRTGSGGFAQARITNTDGRIRIRSIAVSPKASSKRDVKQN